MKKHKFTWIDGLVIAVVLLLLVGTFLKFFVKENTLVNQESVSFEYQLKIEGLRQCSVDSLQPGDEIFDNEGKGQVGVITAVEATPATGLFYTPEGTIEEVVYEERYDVVLTITADGVPEDDVYKVGTYDIKVNQYSTYFTKYSIWSATVIALN